MHLLMERIMALQQMIREKHIIVYSIDFALFLPEANFVRGTFEDFLVSDKI